MKLSERKKKILRAVVEHYIQTAEPVGSKAIIELAELDVSSATIRNELADLTELGLLEQPHTSAGRVPSPKGYRFYVNELMVEHKLSLQETERINQALHMKMAELDKVIDQAGRIVSRMIRYPTFALATGADRITIRRFDLLMVERSAFIVVVMTDNNVVRNKLLRMPTDMSEPQLQMLSTLLNTNFVGLTLGELGPELMRVTACAAGETSGLISLVVSFAMEVLEELEHQSVHTAGVTNLLAHREYRDLEKAQPLMEFLSDQWDTARLPMPEEGTTRIIIGPENVAEELRDASVVLASYDIGENMRGVIGVVGPTRMDYAKIAARLSCFADGLSRLFGRGELPAGGPDPKKEE